jgi:cytoskeletal protein RodZ
VNALNKGIIALIVIVLVVIVGAGLWFAMAPKVNTTPNNSNGSINTAVNTNTNTQSKNNTTTTITAAQAKQYASKYVGTGVALETPTLTTYKGVEVWKVPVVTYTPDKAYLDPIYINAKTGSRVQ